MTSTLLLNNNGSSEINSFFSISASSESSISSSATSSEESSLQSSSSSTGALTALCNNNSNNNNHNNNNEKSTSLKNNSIVQNLLINTSRNLINSNPMNDTLDSPVKIEIPVVHVPTSQSQSSPNKNSTINTNTTTNNSSTCSPFIDPTELKNKFYEFSSKFLLILLDCRTANDFNHKHIKDSVHLNCRDRLTRKRLQSRKLTVKDLISSEEIKNKFEVPVDICEQDNVNSFFEEAVSSTKNSNQTTQSFEDEIKALKNDNNMIVLYDDTTSDLSDLQSDQNPLKIVQENIKQSGYKKDCRILKGGFQSFFESFPEFCNIKDIAEQKRAFFNKYSDRFKEITEDQRQSAIETAVMTEITPYLYLGNEQDAKNCDILEKKGIYYILNVTKNIPFYNSTNSMSNVSSGTAGPFCYKRIAVNDCENQNLKNHFEEAFDFIDQAKLKNHKVLVHCQAGISRSPTIVIAYLMSRFNLEMNDAYNQVKKVRPIIGPNLIFMSQLMDFEINLRGKKSSQTGVTPINVVHTQPTHDNNTPNFNNINQRAYTSTPPSTPVGTHIEVQFINSADDKKENSENNSPDVCQSSSNSYFKLTQSASASTTKCISTANQDTKNNSILVFN